MRSPIWARFARCFSNTSAPKQNAMLNLQATLICPIHTELAYNETCSLLHSSAKHHPGFDFPPFNNHPPTPHLTLHVPTSCPSTLLPVLNQPATIQPLHCNMLLVLRLPVPLHSKALVRANHCPPRPRPTTISPPPVLAILRANLRATKPLPPLTPLLLTRRPSAMQAPTNQ